MAKYKVLEDKEDRKVGAANFSGYLKDATQKDLQYLYETIKHPYVVKTDENAAAKKSKDNSADNANG